MLIEFSVSNFKSIAKKVTFSMVASVSATKKRGATHATGNAMAPHVLTSAVLFGPNASGKSSFIESLLFMRRFALHSETKLTHGDSIPVFQNALHLSSPKPSEFEIFFFYKEKIFQYGFSLNKKRVLEEWLFSRDSKPRARMKIIFQREYNPKKKKYDWNLNSLKDSLMRKKFFKDSTRDNALFLSTAAYLNSKSLLQPFEWINFQLRGIATTQRVLPEFTANLSKEKSNKRLILNLIEDLDLKIQDFRVEQARDSNALDIFTSHKNIKGENVEFPFFVESDGTKVLFSLIGPILDVLANGRTLFVDELNNSLHPHAVEKLIRMFRNKEKNPHGAQLIFSSHDTYAISEDLLHKDQVWFVERPRGLATTLTALSEFKMRETDSFARHYHKGRFGAIPIVNYF